jgi:hypothetical protein
MYQNSLWLKWVRVQQLFHASKPPGLGIFQYILIFDRETSRKYIVNKQAMSDAVGTLLVPQIYFIHYFQQTTHCSIQVCIFRSGTTCLES